MQTLEAAFAQRQISQRGYRHFRQAREKPWQGLRDATASNRQKIATLCDVACSKSGFCGGPGYALNLIANMESLNAADFAWAILEAEGMGATFEYDTTWRPHFEAMFMDVFGDSLVILSN